jgi:deoxyadenosine/deoxycytidine kinase
MYITIIGNVASGKSTAMPILVKALGAQPLYADDLFQTTDPFAERYLQDTPRWALANELWLTYERAQMVNHLVASLAETGNSLDNPGGKHDKTIIVDSGLLMSWVYTYSHLLVKNIDMQEWELYQKLYENLAKDYLEKSCVIRLKYSMPTLMSRLKKRARDYELKFYTEEYLEQIEQGLVALQKKLEENGRKVITIDESEVPDFELNPADADRLVALVKDQV